MGIKIKSKPFGALGSLFYNREFEANALINEIFQAEAYLGNQLQLKPGDVIFDLGANIGLFALYALQKCGYDCQVHSFEPIPLTYQCLKQNLAQYKEQVICNQLAIGDVVEPTEVSFSVFGDSSVTATYRPQDKFESNFEPMLDFERLLIISYYINKPLYYQLKFLPFLRSYLIKRNYKKITLAEQVQCKLTSLSHYVKEHNIEKIDFLKIDVEGAELDVLKGMDEDCFAKTAQISMEVHAIGDRLEQAKALLTAHDFSNITISQGAFFSQLGFNHHMLFANRE